jgi:thiamine-phosphate pyrophosphorylase
VYAKLMEGHSLVAIGGIDESRFAHVRRTGVGSIAVVRALVAAADPEGVARDLMRRLAGA